MVASYFNPILFYIYICLTYFLILYSCGMGLFDVSYLYVAISLNNVVNKGSLKL